MLKPPPLFAEFETAATPPAHVGVDMASGPDCTAYLPVGTATDPDCWATATRIANEVIDAKTLAEIEAVKARNTDPIADLVRRRRDLAEILSSIFTDRRQALGGGR